MHLKLNVYGFALDSIAQMPVVLLKDEEDSITLPIWISSNDALYIVAELIRHDAAAKSDRKDLQTALLNHFEAEIAEIVINDMKDGLFSSSVVLLVGAEQVKLDVRISEALVLALKQSLPVMVSRELMERISLVDEAADERFTDVDERRFVDFLENLDPADLGKYPM